MPATFAHPAAILPLRRFTPRSLNFSALVIGSMSPDFGYFVRRFDVATFAHSIPGTILICLPLGAIAFAVVQLLRAPLTYLLPHPHRTALMPLANARLRLTWRSAFAIALSLLLGAWTHTIADSFTHRTGWVVERVPAMQIVVFRIGLADFPVHQLLQHTGSTLGSIALVAAYVLWLRRQQRRSLAGSERTEVTRVLLIAGCTLVAVAIALPLAWLATSDFSGYLRMRAFAFQAVIYAAQVFAPLIVVTAGLFYLRRDRDRQSRL